MQIVGRCAELTFYDINLEFFYRKIESSDVKHEIIDVYLYEKIKIIDNAVSDSCGNLINL